MNLPNRLTLLRIAMIPLYLALLTGSAGCRIGAALVFAAASITDFFDGRIARSRNLITDFGKFMDPIADKLLVLMPFIYFCAIEPFGTADVWPVMLMVAREIVVSGLRLVASAHGSVINKKLKEYHLWITDLQKAMPSAKETRTATPTGCGAKAGFGS